MALGAGGVPGGEVIGAEIVVRHAARQDVPDGAEHRMLDGPNRFLGPLARLHAVIEPVVLATLDAAGGPRGFVERGAQPVVGLTSGTRTALPGAPRVPGHTRAHEAR